MRLLVFLAFTAATSAATVRVQVGGRVTELDLERYVAGVLAGESSVFQSNEALKAMAVSARTYAVRFGNRHASEGFDLCDTTHCQRLDMKSVTARLNAATAATKGELALYQGKPASTYYHRDCGGRTEDVRAVWKEEPAPYLTSHVDPYCLRGTGSSWHWDASAQELASALREAKLHGPSRIDRVSVSKRTASGRAEELILSGAGENVRISASSLRFAIGRLLGFNRIPSDQYKVGFSANRIVFDGSGSGHGVGLCQNGAEQMGKEGHSYREILAFYYPGTSVGPRTAELEWHRISGERIALFTTQPGRDAEVLRAAERFLSSAERRLQLSAPSAIELRIYPYVASFRDSTGEPGWVAARTSGRRIQMQSVDSLRRLGVLDSTLQHELLHTIIEEHARAGLPLWFREGLTGYLTGPGASIGRSPVRDADLRQTTEQNRARAAYEAARGQVAALVARYGEGTVVGWLRLGLPREVTNASNKQAPTKSK